MSEPAGILIVDDETDVAVTLKAMLEREGYKVLTAMTEEAARRAVAEASFAVVLLDLRFGGADGTELLDEVRAAHPFCEGIVLTGYASLDTAIAAIRKGAYDYLIKPCSLDQLKLTVARAIERATLARASQERLVALEAANKTIEQFARDLELRVEQATATLNQKLQELATTHATLKESQQQRDDFISMLAHELGQPLTAINACAQILQRDKMPESTKVEIRSMLLDETRRLTRLVHNLSDTSILMSDHFGVRLVSADIWQIIQEQVAVAEASAERHRFLLEAMQFSPPLVAECDADRMAQVVSNLLSNAVRYSDGGEVRVTVAVVGDDALITVCDEGPGIPKNRLATIFEPRFRLPLSDARASKGMGLGLSITKAIVTAHGGSISAQNNEDKGASFVVRLPLHPQQAGGEAPPPC